MKKEPLNKPKNPYLIKTRQLGQWGRFPKKSFTNEDVSKFIGNFVSQALTISLKPTQKIVIWRGEMFYEGEHCWVWGLAPGAPKQVGELFEEEATSWPLKEVVYIMDAFEEGFKPFLLILPDQIWVFNSSKKYGSYSEIILGPIKIKAQNLAYRFEKDRYYGGSANNDIKHYLPYWEALRNTLSTSGYHNWEHVQEVVPQWLQDRSHFLYSDFRTLKIICEDIIHLHVKDIEIKEYGRIILSPKFTIYENGYSCDDFNVYIGIRQGLPLGLKTIALAHEMGHYFNHLDYYVLLSMVQIAMLTNPETEAAVASILNPTVLKRCQNIMEKEADRFALNVLLPLPDTPTDPLFDIPVSNGIITDYEILMHMIDEKGFLPRLSIEELLKLFYSFETRKSLDLYDSGSSLSDRLVRGLLMRRSTFSTWGVEEEFQYFMRVLKEIARALDDPTQILQNNPSKNERLFRRASLDEAIGLLANHDHWDPIVIENLGSSERKGYIGIKPAWEIYDKNPRRTDWVRVTDPDRFPGFIDDYLEIGRKAAKGLIIFPITPPEEKLRKEINSGQYMMKKLRKSLKKESHDG